MHTHTGEGGLEVIDCDVGTCKTKRIRLYPERNKTIKLFVACYTLPLGFYHRWYYLYCPINRRFIFLVVHCCSGSSCTPLPTIAPTIAPTRPTTAQSSALHCAIFLPLHPKPPLCVTGTPLDVVSFLFCPLLQNCTHTFDGT